MPLSTIYVDAELQYSVAVNSTTFWKTRFKHSKLDKVTNVVVSTLTMIDHKTNFLEIMPIAIKESKYITKKLDST